MSEHVSRDPNELLQHASWLRKLAHSLVADRAAAEDLVQDTWLSSIRQPPRQLGDLRPWLARVMRNQVLQNQRNASRRRAREEDKPAPEPLPGPQQVLERLDAQRLLMECVSNLQDPYQMAIVLHFYEGLSSAEIARRSGTPAATVRSQIARGLELLRAQLDARHAGKRESWMLLFLPLSNLERPALVLGGAGLVKGLILMSTAMKVMVGSLVIGATALGVHLATGVRQENEVLQAASEHAQPASAPQVAAPALVSTPQNEISAERSLVSPSKATDAPLQAQSVLARILTKIVDEEQAPIAGAKAQLLSFEHPDLPSANSDSLGELSLPLTSSLSKGRFQLLVTAEHYISNRTFFEWDAKSELELDLVILKRGQSLRGWVQDADGQPVEGATIGVTRTIDGFDGLPAAKLAGPGWLAKRELGSSDAFGFFELQDVKLGLIWVWAKNKDSLWSYSESLELGAQTPTNDLLIRLKPIPSANLLSGRILSPEGAPLKGIRLEYGLPGGSNLLAESTESGAFQMIVSKPRLMVLRASDPELRWTDVTRDVQPGSRVELQFKRTRKLHFSVLDEDGLAVGGQTLILQATSRGGAHIARGITIIEGGPDAGTLSLLEPDEPFFVAIERDSYRDVMQGPIQPQELGPLTEIQLETLPGLHGRVLKGKQGVAGAKVLLNELLLGTPGRHTIYYYKGFFSYTNKNDELSAYADADGYYSLYPKNTGSYVLRAEHGSYAPSEVRLTNIDPLAGELAADLQLTAGGSIQGQVLVPAGSSAQGKLVAVSRGDLHPFMMRTDPGGHFRFDHLMPGRWNVEFIVDDIGRQFNSFMISETKPEAPWVCELKEGAELTYDLDLRAGSLARIFGSVFVDAQPAAGWNLEGWAPDHMSGRESSRPSMLLDSEGSFEFESSTTGMFILILRSNQDELPMQLFRSWSVQAGENEVRISLNGAQAELRNLPTQLASGTTLELLWSDPSGLSSRLPLQPDAQGNCSPVGLFAGKIEVVIRTPGKPVEVLQRAQLIAGETTLVQVP